MKLTFDPETLLPRILPAQMPAWAKQFIAVAPATTETYDLALVRRQQQLLRQLSATLESQQAPAFLVSQLDSIADLLGDLVGPYLEKVDTLAEYAIEEIEPGWLPNFSPLPLYWLPSDPAVEVHPDTVEAFDLAATAPASIPDVIVTVSGGVAELAHCPEDVWVEIVDYDNLGFREGQAKVKELLEGEATDTSGAN